MPLTFACIVPHGFPVIPELSPDAEGAMATRSAMEEIERRCRDLQIETIVLAGPHGVRVEGAMCLAYTSRAAGMLRWKGRQVEMNVPVDGPLTDSIAAAAREFGVPVALAGYAGNRREQSVLPLDWGGLVPLWFLGHDVDIPGSGDVFGDPPIEDHGPPVVLITPSRALPRSAMVTFGQALAAALAADPRRIAFVASCDWAHTHSADGPYGAHPAAKVVDALVVEAIRANDPGRLIDLDEDLVQHGAIDGLWQTLMLAGIMESVPMTGELLSYEAPTYYGMLVAAFEPVR